MGFRAPDDVTSLGHHLLELPKVTGVFVLSRNDHDATMWVTVLGFDPEGALARRRVYEIVETFIANRRADIKAGNVAFDYFVLVDDDEVGEPQVPPEAARLAA